MQQAIGEDMAAIGVRTELDLIDGDELGLAVQRHRLDGARIPARAGGDDLLLPGNKGHVAHPFARHHAVIVLAREQPQRETNNAGAMGQHALDGEMGLAGVGRAKHGLDPMPEHRKGRGPRRESGHALMVVCCTAECKARKQVAAPSVVHPR